MGKLPDIRQVSVKGKRVLLRVDLDVPVVKGKVSDAVRLKACMPTITYLLNHGAIIILLGHRGRPEKEDDQYSLEPIAQWFMAHIKHGKQRVEKQHIGTFKGWQLAANVLLLENIRFFPEEKHPETEKGETLSKDLASLADIYVNDAFAVSHRAHVSVSGVAGFLPHFAGIRLQEEVSALQNVVVDPKRPLVVLIGGAKIETKLPLVERMHQFADYVLVGGKIAEETRVLLHIQHEKTKKKRSILLVADLTDDGFDITEKSAGNFMQVIRTAKTIIWNGPMGKISQRKDKRGETTGRIAKAIVDSGAYSVVGGGDTVAYLGEENLFEKYSFVSMGGGAMLSFLSGEKMPGLLALQQ